MRVPINRQKIQLILDWCQKEFGLSIHHDSTPTFKIYKTSGTAYNALGMRGLYYSKTNIISIYLGSHTSVLDVCQTIIHEYNHYLQDDEDYIKQYRKLAKSGLNKDDIDIKHPHEKKCRDMELVCGNTCFKELRYKLYKK